MNNKVNKRKLKIIKHFFLRMKESLSDLDYWQKENEYGVVDLVKGVSSGKCGFTTLRAFFLLIPMVRVDLKTL